MLTLLKLAAERIEELENQLDNSMPKAKIEEVLNHAIKYGTAVDERGLEQLKQDLLND